MTITTTSLAPGPLPTLVVRPAEPGDLPELEALLDRCSPETLYRRFHGAAGPTERRQLARIAVPSPTHRSWVAVDGDHIRGTATLAWGSDGRAEVAFLVEDAWFRQGVGTALFRALGVEARRSGLDEVVAWVQTDNRAARDFLRSMAPGAASAFAGGGELEISVPVVAPEVDQATSPSVASGPSGSFAARQEIA
jgi:N-acetylglutamate synthase-like GNAT family acetyltransferase